MKTIQEIAANVLACQNACNLSGLVHSWSEWLPIIRQDAVARGIPPNTHPCNVWMANKISQLADSESIATQSTAYDLLVKISNGG